MIKVIKDFFYYLFIIVFTFLCVMTVVAIGFVVYEHGNDPTPEYARIVNEKARREQNKIWLRECLKKEPDIYKCSQYFD